MGDKQRLNFVKAIKGLFVQWAICVGFLAGLSLLSMWIPMFWVPFIGLCMAIIVYHYHCQTGKEKPQVCGRAYYVANLTLGWSSLIMIVWHLVINHTDWVSEIWLKHTPLNFEIPYIPILITGPMATLICGWLLSRRRKHPYCRRCIIVNGEPAERGFLGRLFDQESSAQIWLLFGLSLFLTIGEYIYYVLSFITTDLNGSDKFFFGWVPTIIYLMSLIYLALRYLGIIAYYNREMSGSVFNNGNFSMVRFLVISGDHLLLAEPETMSSSANLQNSKYDTPAALTAGYHKRVEVWEAETYFRGTAGIDAGTRFLYRTDTEDSGSNIFHFAAIIDDPAEIEKSRLKGEWVTQGALQGMIDRHQIAPLLVSELNRIFHITLAWKTYDRTGHRLYAIKHYKPAFRLRELPTSDVDFNDSTWLRVADNNEDRPFFRLRKWWHKYISSNGR